VILAGRRTNDGMGPYVASEVIRLMVRKGINPVQARVLVLGLAFKENCPDLRNTRVVDIICALRAYNVQVDIHDPWADGEEARQEYGLELIDTLPAGVYDAVLLTVAHREFRELASGGVRRLVRNGGVVYDVKGLLPRDDVDGRL